MYIWAIRAGHVLNTTCSTPRLLLNLRLVSPKSGQQSIAGWLAECHVVSEPKIYMVFLLVRSTENDHVIRLPNMEIFSKIVEQPFLQKTWCTCTTTWSSTLETTNWVYQSVLPEYERRPQKKNCIQERYGELIHVNISCKHNAPCILNSHDGADGLAIA